MDLPFTKMHGCRNDYVVVDGFRHTIDDPAALARAVGDRRSGVGSDGLLLALPADDKADLRMRMFNPDGSEAEMCGNGLRCVVLFAAARGLVADPAAVTVATGAGILEASIEPGGSPGAAHVTVDMGAPVLERTAIPMRGPPGRVVDEALDVQGTSYGLTALSMGNPHVVMFVEDVEAVRVTELGPRLETHAAFPNRANVEFVQVVDPHVVRQRTWERGVGETLACGTGACAVAVAGALTGRTERAVSVHLLGGTLAVQWGDDDHVRMTGPAVAVFEGVWPGV